MFQNRYIRILLILVLGIIVPSILFVLFPDIVTDISSFLTVDNFIKAILGILFLCVYFYICMLGAYKFPILPLCVLFFYQIFQYLLNKFSPITFNYRILVLLFILPVIFIVWNREHIKNYLYPFLGLGLFYLLNIVYAVINYAHSPNFTYNLNLYLQKRDPLLPTIYSIDIFIFLTFLIIGVYLSVNLTKGESKKINAQFAVILLYFFAGAALISILGYMMSDLRFVEVVSGVKRLKGVSSNSNLLGFLNVCVSLFLVKFFYFSKDEFLKNLTKFVLFLIYITTLLTFSRTNIAFLTMIYLFNFVVLSKNVMQTAFRVIGFVCVLCVLFFTMDFIFSWGVIDRLLVRFADQESSNYRPMLLEYLFSQQGFDLSIIFGHGIGASSSTLFTLFSSRYDIAASSIIYHPHNSYVQIFFDYGLLGVLFYFSTLFMIWWRALKNTINSRFLDINSLLLFELVSFALAASLVDSYLLNVEIIPFWIILGIMYVNSLIVVRKEHVKS